MPQNMDFLLQYSEEISGFGKGDPSNSLQSQAQNTTNIPHFEQQSQTKKSYLIPKVLYNKFMSPMDSQKQSNQGRERGMASDHLESQNEKQEAKLKQQQFIYKRIKIGDFENPFIRPSATKNRDFEEIVADNNDDEAMKSISNERELAQEFTFQQKIKQISQAILQLFDQMRQQHELSQSQISGDSMDKDSAILETMQILFCGPNPLCSDFSQLDQKGLDNEFALVKELINVLEEQKFTKEDIMRNTLLQHGKELVGYCMQNNKAYWEKVLVQNLIQFNPNIVVTQNTRDLAEHYVGVYKSTIKKR